MPPQFLFDLSKIDLGNLMLDQEAIRKLNPHRGDMELLNGVIWSNPDAGQILGYKEVRKKILEGRDGTEGDGGGGGAGGESEGDSSDS